MTTITHVSHPEHPLIQKEEGFVPENKALYRCYGCDHSLTNKASSDVYSCSVCENWFLHKDCAQFPTHITHLKHPHHPLILVPRMPSLNACNICGSKSKVFAYRCNPCDFDVCAICVYFMYKEHLLFLDEEDVVIGKDVLCEGCYEPLTDSTFYTSTSNGGKKFYLHRTCVELPAKINHSTHTDCELFLNLSLQSDLTSCNLCFRQRNSTFRCTPCDYDVCSKCAFKDRVIIHEGHKHHSLTFRYQQVLFHCHACTEKAEDSSYTCNTCDFWIHDSCASAPTTISSTTYHHHPLHLVYSIPDIHLYFSRFCGLCKEYVIPRHWVYYCHKCTYFVHMRCATTWDGETMIKEIEGDCANDDPNLVQFPLPTDESLFDLLIHQFRKSQIDFKEVSSTSSVGPEDPPNYVNGRHWSHTDHPLQELHLSTFKDEDEDDEESLMVCDGCTRPISDAYPSFYGCIQCGFFLHKFCASTLPRELPAGASPFHPEHSLFLHKMDKFYEVITCGSCNFVTNGYYYHCETCGINVDIHCTFLPSTIKYEAHKFHSLVQHAATESECNITKRNITKGFGYGCGSCSNFHIHKACIFYPSRMRHRWDSHTVTLRYPPFFYEGVFYCQICEEQVNNNRWLYHCDDCDQSFHSTCLRPLGNVKLAQTIVLGIDNQKHTLTFVLKVLKRDNSAPYICKICGNAFRNDFMLECAGCGYLVCIPCFKNRIQME